LSICCLGVVGDVNRHQPSGRIWTDRPAAAGARFFDVYAQATDATIRRARGLAAMKSLFLLLMGQHGDRGLPGGKPTWGPAAGQHSIVFCAAGR
jgi:hypothetical protein